jgi:coenzyme F420 hydrogenase subunit beta
VTVALSFFCAGIPSFRGTDELLREMGVAPNDVRAFRYRGHGWPGSAAASTDLGESEMDYHDSWAKVLTRFRHERCKICPDGTGELADITFGDAWHLDTGRPSFAEADGRSLIITRTAVGAAALAGAAGAGVISANDFSLKDIALIQPYQAKRKGPIAARLVGRRLVGSAVPHFRHLGLLAAAKQDGLQSFAMETRGAAARAARAHPRRWHRWVPSLR